ncbi:MAG: hypothetical protein IKQ91_06445 [Oscillospiraceae bacterium]|nr:hypothetical protein [Oscillospiraceae bacterium]
MKTAVVYWSVTSNLGLILLGAAGILPLAAFALLYNASILAVGLKSMADLSVWKND